MFIIIYLTLIIATLTQPVHEFNQSIHNDNQQFVDFYSLIFDEALGIMDSPDDRMQMKNLVENAVIIVKQYDNQTKNYIKNLTISSVPYIINATDEQQQIAQSDFKYFNSLNDSSKSVLLQYIIQNIAQNNQTNITQTFSNINDIIQFSESNPDYDYQIEPQEWQNFTEPRPDMRDEINKYLNQTNQTIDFDIYSDDLTQEQQDQLAELFEKALNHIQEQEENVDQSNDKSQEKDTSTNSTASPISTTTEDTEQEELSLFVVILVLLLSTLALIVLLLFRRYMNRKKLLPFKMNEELTVQGQQAI